MNFDVGCWNADDTRDTPSASATALGLRSALRSPSQEARKSSDPRVLTWLTDPRSDTSQSSRHSSNYELSEVQREAEPHPLRDFVEKELQQLRNADMTASFYDSDWD